jgi:hypothetical protein
MHGRTHARFVPVTGFMLAAWIASAGAAGAATLTETTRLQASDAPGGASFGGSVALAGNTAVVGARHGETAEGVQTGAAYVFVGVGPSWHEQAKLLPSDGENGDLFGSAVAISGDTAVVAALDGNPLLDESGAVYVFVRNGASWSAQAVLLGGGDDDRFGTSVAISGETIAVGAPGDNTVYVFVRHGTSWSQQDTLVPSILGGSDNFGDSVALEGDTLAVGSPYNEGNGAAYIFTRSGTVWTEQEKLSVSGSGSRFGDSIALSGGTVVGGAPKTGLLQEGVAYVFVGSGATWSQQAQLDASDGTSLNDFGRSVALLGDTAVVGAPGADDTRGAAYKFVRDGSTWSEEARLLASDREQSDSFAPAAVAGSAVLVGASGAGTVYVYSPPTDFYPVTPCRVLDTRQPGQGPALADGVSRIAAFHGTCGVPATARAVAVNVVVVQPAGAGSLALYPSDVPHPGTDFLPFTAGRNQTNNAILLLAFDGTLTAAPVVAGGGSAHLIIDVAGYFE